MTNGATKLDPGIAGLVRHPPLAVVAKSVPISNLLDALAEIERLKAELAQTVPLKSHIGIKRELKDVRQGRNAERESRIKAEDAAIQAGTLVKFLVCLRDQDRGMGEALKIIAASNILNVEGYLDLLSKIEDFKTAQESRQPSRLSRPA